MVLRVQFEGLENLTEAKLVVFDTTCILAWQYTPIKVWSN